jgi:branched-chain amino acid aminotransferase
MTGLVWWNGTVCPTDEVTTAVTSETALRGVNAFEGIRAYWQEGSGRFAVVSLERHLERLRSSLSLLSLPAEHLVAPLGTAICDLVGASQEGADYYVRPTVYLEKGSYTADPAECRFGSFVTIREASTGTPLSCRVSSYRRIPSSAFPSRAKSGASYSAFRLARIEAVTDGYDEAILLDMNDRVSETGGASVFVVKDGVVTTPGLDHDILDSITRHHAIAIARGRLRCAVEERSLKLEDLMSAEEIFLAGTLDEIRVVRRLAGRGKNLNHRVGTAVRDEYLAICQGQAEPLEERMLKYVTPTSSEG